MGLDTTHGCWHGSYGSFHGFRTRIAKEIGEDLNSFYGFGGDKPFYEVSHPIVPLLDHSDCEGELSVEECESIVEGINMILQDLPESDDEMDVWFKDRLVQFKEGCEYAIEEGEIVEFG